MFERVIAFLKDLPGSSPAPRRRGEDPRVAAAALLYHVMDADGIRQDVEWDRIKQALSDSYGVTGSELDELVQAGAAADHEAVDLYAFTSILNRHLDEPGKIGFIRLLWDVVYADGVLDELEDNVVWRIAELIGVENRDRILARQDAARHVPGARGEAADE